MGPVFIGGGADHLECIRPERSERLEDCFSTTSYRNCAVRSCGVGTRDGCQLLEAYAPPEPDSGTAASLLELMAERIYIRDRGNAWY
jgi:hypothetical protein